MNRNPLLYKVLMICILALLLLIPLGMIESKISERQLLQQNVQQDISRSSAGSQVISGPFLVLRYRVLDRVAQKEGGNETRSKVVETVLPAHQLKVDGNVAVETRNRGIYKVRLFNLHSQLTGSFVIPRGYGSNAVVEDMQPVAAYFVMKVSDARGIANVPTLTLNGLKYDFSPGVAMPVVGNGMHVVLNQLDARQEHNLSFSFPLDLQGTTSLAVEPSGESTQLSLKSAWPHPSFGGGFLPQTRKVDSAGFTAQWLVSNLARNAHAENTNMAQASDVMSVDFIDPVNIYLLSERAVKYGIMFVLLIFTAFFMFEVLQGLKIHAMQYLLVGLAMAMFFLLLISLSEHVAFVAAYCISGTACVSLIGVYIAGMLRNLKSAITFSSGIALLYALLYGVLQSEDNALLMGTLVLFLALAVVMLLTRRMDWYSLSQAPEKVLS
jgi:inner membrane protein